MDQATVCLENSLNWTCRNKPLNSVDRGDVERTSGVRPNMATHFLANTKENLNKRRPPPVFKFSSSWIRAKFSYKATWLRSRRKKKTIWSRIIRSNRLDLHVNACLSDRFAFFCNSVLNTENIGSHGIRIYRVTALLQTQRDEPPAF